MNILNGTLRVLLCLLLAMPILGVLGVFPPPTADMYNTPEAFAFIEMLMEGKYVNYIMGIVFVLTVILTITNRMAAAALLLLPVTVNIISFHAFLDGGLLTAGAIMANALALINLYFLWTNRARYKTLLDKTY